MAFERPTLQQLVRRIKGDIKSRLPGADANLRGTPEEVLAIASAGLAHGIHGHVKWVTKQVLADLSDEPFLLRECGLYGIERTAAVKADGQATIVGTDGTPCPDGTIWVRTDGREYRQNGAETISGGTATIDVVAVEGGVDGNCAVGTKLAIATAVVGINSVATVIGAEGIEGGLDIETIPSVRQRLLARKRNPPKGGGPGDYEAWALSYPGGGVTRAWEVPLQFGLMTVGLYFVRDNDVSLIPDAGEVTALQTYMDGLRPVTAELFVNAPTDSPLNFTFSSLSPNTEEVQAAVEAELGAYLSANAQPNGATTLRISHIREAISIATGEDDHVLASPSADIVVPLGTIRTPGVFTWP